MKVASEPKEPLLANEAVPVGVPVAPAGTVQPSGVPAPQTMERHWRQMLDTPGLLMRERVSLLQFLFAACEKRTSFAVGPYPMEAQATSPHVHLDDEAFKQSLTQGLFEVRERPPQGSGSRSNVAS